MWTAEVRTPVRFRSELNFAIDAAFRRHGIQIPFPQRDLHFKSGAVRLSEPPGAGSLNLGPPPAAHGPSAGEGRG